MSFSGLHSVIEICASGITVVGVRTRLVCVRRAESGERRA